MRIIGSLGRYRRLLISLATIVVVVIFANLVSETFSDLLAMEIRPGNEDMVHRFVVLAAIVYATLIAIPFVPGVEIALTLIAMLGPQIVLLVYVSTLAGLCLAYCMGRLVPTAALARLLSEVGLIRASRLLREIEPLDPQDRLDLILSKVPKPFAPLLKYRYVALALLLNVPGNIIIGGGGGIAMLAGASRLYSAPGFVFTIIVAVAPVPVMVLLFGAEIVTH